MPLLIVEEEDGRIALSSPYHPNFPPRARSLGGIWDTARRVWIFDAGDHDRVRSLCREIYGSDGLENGKARMAPFPETVRQGGMSSPNARPLCRTITATAAGCASG